VVDTDQGSGGSNPNAQLLEQLSCQTRFGCLARFQLAPGEFPQTALVDVGGAFRDQNPAARILDRTRRDVDLLAHLAL
jgi:hypothetical protein